LSSEKKTLFENKNEYGAHKRNEMMMVKTETSDFKYTATFRGEKVAVIKCRIFLVISSNKSTKI